MNKLAIIISLILAIVVLGGCITLEPPAAPTSAPEPALAPSPTSAPVQPPVVISTPSNPDPDLRIAELEAKVRQLETENQQRLAENRQLISKLTKIQNLVDSAAYRQTLINLTGIQSNTSSLIRFVQGLPDLPALPPGLTVGQIDKVINDVQDLREILKFLPPPPPFAPKEWIELDDMKKELIDMTEWMEDLRNLPEFLTAAESLNDIKSRIEAYLADVDNAISETRTVLEEVRNTTSSP